MGSAEATLVGRLRRHARERPSARGFILLENGERESGSRTFAELDARARRIAAWLARSGCAGERVVLLLRDGLDFIDALLGCQYAGAVPMPAVVPRPNRSLDGVLAIAADAQAAAVLASRSDAAQLRPQISASLPELAWLCLEDAEGCADEWYGREPAAESLALLQYTSGSTSTPKGVMVTHANVMHNQAAIRHSMRLSERSLFVGWLPLFHDMGLIGNVMQSLYLGIPCVLMPPVAFLQRPLRWLSAISRYRATISGAPNSAYDLAVDRTTPEQRAGLDLSSWAVAFNGSEPVRIETLERFAAAFAPAKFRRSALYPCYGMAESTLLISGVAQGSEPEVVPHESARCVSCGRPAPGTRIAIVDPASCARVPDGAVGEIWVSGGSVALGYYNRPAQTDETFNARIAGSGEGPYLRTGDLGFLQDGRLFVTGRIKDLIIVRGRNHCPMDLEDTAACANPMLAKGAGAAVGLEHARYASVAIVHELTREGWRRADREAVAADIREAIAAKHELQVSRVLLIRPGTLPRTTSGKLRRSACRALLQAT